MASDLTVPDSADKAALAADARLLSPSPEHVFAVWNLIIRPPRARYSQEDLFREYPSEGFRIQGQHVTRTDFTILNKNGVELACTLFQPAALAVGTSANSLVEHEERACVVFCHAAHSSRINGFELIPVFLPLNISLLCFDFAGSGMSGGDTVSLGFYERHDLRCVIEHLRSERGFSHIGVWARCMGAAAALMHSPDDPSLAGIVADSPFSDLWELMRETCAKHVPLPSFLISPLLHIVRLAIKSKAGFDMCEVSPQACMDRCFVPTLFLHGEEDEFTKSWHIDALKRGCQGEAMRLEMPGTTHLSARPDEFIARAAVFMVRALRWEKHLPANVVDTGRGFAIQKGPSSDTSDATDLEELSSSSDSSAARPCPGDLYGAVRVLPPDPHEGSGKQSHAESLASSLASACFGSSPPSLRADAKMSLTSCSPTRGAAGKSGQSSKEPASSTAADRTSTTSASPDAPQIVTPRTAAAKGTAPPPPRKGAGKCLPPKGTGKGPSPHGQKGKGSGSTQEPREPDSIPRVPVRRLFWTPISLEGNMESGVWGNIHRKGGANFDRDELEALFAQNGNAAARGAKAAEKPKVARRKHLLEEQRRRKLWCMLAKLPEQDELLKAVTFMDDEVLSAEMLDLLLSNLPSAAEESLVKAVAAAEDEDAAATEAWEVPEEFLIKLVAIPEYALRVKVWAFLGSAEEAHERMSAAEVSARAACDCLRSSARIEKLLAVALSVGNYLNGGTPRGCADGFELGNLSKLTELKAAQHTQGTLLDFIVAQVEKDSPGMLRQIFSTGGEFDCVHQVFRINMTEMKDELGQLCTRAGGFLSKFEEFVGNSAEGPVTAALSMRRDELQLRVQHLKEMCARFDDWENCYMQLCKWFRVEAKNSKATPTDEFFGLWEAFLSDVRKALGALEKRQQQHKERSDLPAMQRVTPRSPRLPRARSGSAAKRPVRSVTPTRRGNSGTGDAGQTHAVPPLCLNDALKVVA